MMFQIYEYIYPTQDNQVDFIPVNSITGSSIAIYKNGIKDIDNTLVFTTSNKLNPATRKMTITFTLANPITINDYIVVESSGNTPMIFGDYSNVYIKRYGAPTEPRLLNDQTYKISFDIPNLEVVTSFTSRYDPLYCSARVVREDIETLVDLTEDAINWVIYQNSQRVLLFMNGGGDLNFNMPTPYLLKYPEKIPYNIQQHVKFSAERDILSAAFLQMTGESGLVSKKLGDFTIDKNLALPEITEMIRHVEIKLAQYPLTGAKIITTFTKSASTDTWPVTSPRRSF